MLRATLVTVVCVFWVESATAQAPQPLAFDDFAAVRALSDPQVSPDGGRVLYAVRTTDVEANRRTTVTYVLPITGGAPRPFPDDSTRASEARWSPDGRWIAYIAGGQLWRGNPDGSARIKLTSLNGGASGPVWAATSDKIAFVSAVYPECRNDACNAERDKAKEANKVKARVADQLMYRHWNAWDEGTRSHLFVVGTDGKGLVDLTEGATYDVPPPPFGGSEGYTLSPDGREAAYTAKDQGRLEAWSTDVNVYVVPVSGRDAKGGAAAKVISVDNKGADQNPVYSPDGRFIAYASQARAGFESDRWRLMFYDRSAGTATETLRGWDRNADSYMFAPDGRSVLVTTQDRGRDRIFRAPLDAAGKAGQPQVIVGDKNNVALSMSRDGRRLVWLRDATERPAEVYTAALGARGVSDLRQLTRENDALIARLRLNPVEEFWFKGAIGDSVHGFVLKPPRWEAGKKYPVVLLIHGGPQGAWLDTWHSRWNYQMFAAPGFGVVIVNPRGSTGYGQAFVDSVTKDWGGKVYTDLMNGLDASLRQFSWLDGTRIGAAGGSFGGYMVNWIAGHSDRFKALFSHAGVFNLEHMYGATEELWFTDWEFGGAYWDSTAMAAQYRVFSPHLAAKNFRTPTLVIHGELDYRVPYTEGLSMFTALQRQGVPSRLVVFPDEGHWIAKPQNQRLWWTEVQSWFRKFLTPADARA